MGRPTALIRVPGRGWLRFDRPVEVLVAWTPSDIEALLETLRRTVAGSPGTGDGRWAVGFFAYEATPAFDPAFAAHPPLPGVPVAWWGIFDPPEELRTLPEPAAGSGEAPELTWHPLVSRQDHASAVETVRRHIAEGDTYQVNLTYPLEAPMAASIEPYRLFHQWIGSGPPPPYGVWLDTGDLAVASMSPELFFQLRGNQALSRPMKGTSSRGRWWGEDEQRRAEVLSEKNRAENLMIVDMVRNDLGRVAAPGSVRVTRLFGVETYATVHQLTSDVSARLEPGLDAFDVLRALFPSASITGAPKARTSHLIRDLEPHPRGVYTGSAGYFAPDGSAQLNVLIRTAIFDRHRGVVRYGTGGGVVWDSRADSEFDEARLKTRVVTRQDSCSATDDFQLLETMLWRPAVGYFLLAYHLRRLADSARFFGFAADLAVIEQGLQRLAGGWDERRRVRLTVDRQGAARIEHALEPRSVRRSIRLTFDDRPVDDQDVLLFHKTTRRAVYEDAVARHPGADDVLLWNEQGEVTESSRANLIVQRGCRFLTPARACGLLAGTFRQALLDRGSLEECVLTRADLVAADRVFLVNSVRGIQSVGEIEGL